MTKNEASYKNTLSEKNNCDELFDLSCSVTELISEEKRPSLYSLSLTDSVCSDSTMDFSVKDNNINNEELLKSCKSGEHIEGSLKAIDGSMKNKFRKYMSLHDVSDMIPSQMTPKSVNTVSCETIHSQSLSSTTKSKDSGFHRSVSCLSLTSGKRNYDHIESKVKAYIRNIKESEAQRKRNKLKQKCETLNNPESIIADNESDIIMDKEDLLIKIQELKHELHEKSLYIDAQQKNYNNLLLKFAEAKNTIDALRLQRISLDYSSLNESRNTPSRIQNLNLDVFFQEINNKSTHKENFTDFNIDESKNVEEKCLKHEQVSLRSTISNNSLIEDFKPKTHSTPERSKSCKCLSPVSKLFSSSSRLDKQCEPLVSIQKQPTHSNTNGALSKSCGTINKPAQLLKSSTKKSKLSSVIGLIKKRNYFGVKQKKETTPKDPSNHIDLPHIDPFDKVKKWQASLPNINLLGTQSSSDHEDSRTEEKDGEINSLLSQELVTKCKISEREVVSSHQVKQHLSREHDDRVKRCSTENNKNPKSCSVIDNSSASVKLKNNRQIKKSSKIIRNVCDGEKVENLLSDQTLPKNRASIRMLLSNNSVSEDESQSLMPKSSSISRSGRTVLNDSSDDTCTDDSSSISSSVLGPSPCLPSKKSKRKHLQNKCNLLNKIPKLGAEKNICSNFVLRKPTLNVTITDDSFSKDHRKAQSPNTNSRNSNSSILNLKTESSQRKAWNARNKANFYVCQEFSYKQKSNSLQTCITDMEGMVQKSFPIIDNVLERSICK